MKRGVLKSRGAKSEDAGQSLLASEEVELDLEAPTPHELLEVTKLDFHLAGPCFPVRVLVDSCRLFWRRDLPMTWV